MSKVYYVGDVHGFSTFKKHILEKNNIKNSTIIQVGDFGIGFSNLKTDENNLIMLNNYLKETDNQMYVIRGNHDDPTFFKGNYKLSNIELVEDYSVKRINGKKTLFVGGAISIDRKYRIANNKGYWVDESFVLDKDKLNKIDLETIEVLVTHTTTTDCLDDLNDNKILNGKIVNTFVSMFADYLLIKDLKEENNLVTQLNNMLPSLKEHYYGHYHASREFIDSKGCKHKLLNIDEVYHAE